MSAEDFLPTRVRGIAGLRAAAADCEGCHLYERATQTVFGAGKARAAVVVVGETPGDVEDKEGKPFVGPAGRVLDDAFERIGVDGASLYVTNAVKHFKWEARGKARLHKTPSAREVTACRPWLMAELKIVRPTLIVCLGAVAAHSLLGASVKVLELRGRIVDGPFEHPVLVTVHPASVLRSEDRHDAFEQFVKDLRPLLDYV